MVAPRIPPACSVHPVWRRFHLHLYMQATAFSRFAYKMMLHRTTNVFSIEHVLHQHHLYSISAIFLPIPSHFSSTIIYWITLDHRKTISNISQHEIRKFWWPKWSKVNSVIFKRWSVCWNKFEWFNDEIICIMCI